MTKQKPPGRPPKRASGKPSSTHQTIMDKVNIKRVKRIKKKATTKEKILAGLGVGGALMGGVGAVAPQEGKTQIVSRQAPQQTSATAKAKQVLKDIFGISEAKASNATLENISSRGGSAGTVRTQVSSPVTSDTDASAPAVDDSAPTVDDSAPATSSNLGSGETEVAKRGTVIPIIRDRVVDDRTTTGAVSIPPASPVSTGNFVAAPSLSFANKTTGNASTFHVGESYDLVVTGPEGASVYVTSNLHPDLPKYKMGTIQNGKLELTGTYAAGDVGHVTETWYVGSDAGSAALASSLDFNVVAPAVVAPTLTFTNKTTGNASTFHVGETYDLSITGPANSNVYVTYSRPDGTSGTRQLWTGKTLDANGNFELSDTYISASIGHWTETWYVGSDPASAQLAGSLDFNVVAPSQVTPTLTFTRKNSAGAIVPNTALFNVGDRYDLTITGPEGASVYVTSNLHPDLPKYKMGTIQNGKLELTGTYAAGDVGHVTETWYVGSDTSSAVAAGSLDFSVVAPTVVAPTLTFTNKTTGNASTFHVGETYDLSITGPANSNVYVTYSRPDGTSGTRQLWTGKTLDANGNFELSDTYTSSSIGHWTETWYVGSDAGSAALAGSLDFNVVAPAVVAPTLTFTRKNSAGAVVPNASIFNVSDSYDLVVTGPEGASVYVTSNLHPDLPKYKMGTIQNGKLELTGTYAAGDVGHVTETWYVGSDAGSAALAGSLDFNVVPAVVVAPPVYTTPTVTSVDLTKASIPNLMVGATDSSITAAVNLSDSTVSRAVTVASSDATVATITVDANGVITITGVKAGTAKITVHSITAGGDTSQDKTITVTVVAAVLPVSFSTQAALLGATAGSDYSQKIAATGGTGALSFSLASGSLPGGLVLFPDGTLAGNPTAIGDFSFSLTATDTAGKTATQIFTLHVAQGAPTLSLSSSTVNLSLATGGAPTATVTATVATAGAASTGQVTASSSDSGVAMVLVDSSTGEITIQAVSAGTSTITVHPTALGGDTSMDKTITVTVTGQIAAPPSITTEATLAAGTVAASYSTTIAATGGTGALSFTVSSGQLPDGLLLFSDGTLAGMPTAAGDYSFTVTVADDAGLTATKTFALHVNVQVVTLAVTSSATLSAGTVGSNYSQSITATGGTGALSFTVSSGQLPDGLLLFSDGTLTGTPKTAGDSTFAVTVTDSNSQTVTQTFTLHVNAAPVVITSSGGGGGGISNYTGMSTGGMASGGGVVTAQVAGAQIFQGLQMPSGLQMQDQAQSAAADLTQYHIGKTYYGYSPSTGQIIAFASPAQLSQYFSGGVNKKAPVLPVGVDHSAADSAPGELIPGQSVVQFVGSQPLAAAQSAAQVAGAQITAPTYTVKKGDTLWSIAKKQYGDGKLWRKILEANTDKLKNPKSLRVGMELEIPEI